MVGLAVAPPEDDGLEEEPLVRVFGAGACYDHSVAMLVGLGFPRGVLPLRNLEECGGDRSTGFIWMKQSSPCEHYFEGTRTLVRYAKEVTAHVERSRMSRITGIKCRQMLVWIPVTEMSVVEGSAAGKRVWFGTPLGIRRSFPFSAFQDGEGDC